MNNSKLIKLFIGLSRSELLEFGRYIKTPFFNRDENLVKLYEYIKKYSPEYDSPKLEKTYFLKKVAKNQEVKSRQIHDWMSDLTRKLEDYLIYVQVREQPLNRDFVLLDAMKDRQMDDLFFRSIKNMRTKLDSSPERDMFYYFNQWRLRHEAYFYTGDSKRYRDEVDIKKTMSEVDQFFCAVKLRYSAEMMTLETEYSGDHSIALLPEVLREIRKPNYRKNQLFRIYELVIDLFYEEKNRDKTYDQLEKLIYEHLSLGNEDEKHTLLNFLLTHANRGLIEGKSIYRQKMFDWYVYKIENNLILEDGYLPTMHFLNVMYLSMALKETGWLENFIDDYTDFLSEDVRSNTSLLAKTHLYFAKKEYKKSLRLLRQISGTEFIYPIISRTLTIQCLYELQETELILIECNNFSKYLNRNNKMATQIKNPVKNLIRFVKLLSEAPYRKELTKEKLLEKLNAMKSIRAKSWLSEKIERVK